MDVSRPVDESGCGPVGAMGLVTLVYEDGIVTIGTSYSILVLGDTLFYTRPCFTNVLLVAGRAGNNVNTHPTFVRRRCVDQAVSKCVGLPEGEADTSLRQRALEGLESLHVRKAQRGLMVWASSGAIVEGPLDLGEGLVEDILGVGQAGKGGPQVGQLRIKVF